MTVSRAGLPCAAVLCALLLAGGVAGREASQATKPGGVVVITIDALRADRLGSYGYTRDTSPRIDALLARGVRFTRAWCVEPLTNPSLTSMITGSPPHVHGATRNGLRMAPGLPSLPLELQSHGWQTAGFVSNWSLKHRISRLGDHFDLYEGVFTRRRWFGLFNREATGEDVTDRALEWLEDERRPEQPFFLWVHYVEPHAPYRFHEDKAEALGISKGHASKSDSYDTEVLAVDHAVGRLLDGLYDEIGEQQLLIIFAADHGESLGEHSYWGHGRHLYEPCLHIPLGIVWPGHIEPGTETAPALITDIAPTVLGLLDIPAPETFTGVSWSASLTGKTASERGPLCFQAHKGAVKMHRDSEHARTDGLLEVGVITGNVKEILRIRKNHLSKFDLAKDPRELDDLADGRSMELMSCVGAITKGLGALDRLAVPHLDDESIEQLRNLGYLD